MSFICRPQASLEAPGSKREVGGNRRSASVRGRTLADSSASERLSTPPLLKQADFDELEIMGNSTVLDRQDLQPTVQGRKITSEKLRLIIPFLIISSDDCVYIAERLPSRVIGNPWQLVFTTETDGFSLNNIYRKVDGLERNSPTLIAIRDTEDCCFGALVSDNPSVSEKFYGTGESFLWRTKPDRQVCI